MSPSRTKRASTVAESVAFAHKGLVAARTAESVLVGLGGVGCLLAVAIWSGGSVGSLDTWIVATACGVLVAMTFARSQGTNRMDTARLLDARLGARGALVTAFENSVCARPTSVASLLESHMSAVISPSIASNSVLPLSVLPLIAPFAAAALFAVARDTVSEPRAATLSDLTSELSNRLIRSGGLALDAIEAPEGAGSPEIDRDLPTRLRELARSASWLLETPEGLQRVDGDLLDDIARIDRDIQELRSALPPASSVDQTLQGASTLLDAARMRLGRTAAIPSGPAAAQVETTRMMESPGGAVGAAPVESPISASGDMEGPAPTMNEFAAIDVGWWLPEFDAVVADWIERRKASSSNGGQG